jgi:hypothetical protein
MDKNAICGGCLCGSVRYASDNLTFATTVQIVDGAVAHRS